MVSKIAVRARNVAQNQPYRLRVRLIALLYKPVRLVKRLRPLQQRLRRLYVARVRVTKPSVVVQNAVLRA